MVYNSIILVSIITIIRYYVYIILGAGVVVNRTSFVHGTGPIWLDNVACGGIESNLVNCPATNAYYENHDCDHQEDAGVRCLTGD